MSVTTRVYHALISCIVPYEANQNILILTQITNKFVWSHLDRRGAALRSFVNQYSIRNDLIFKAHFSVDYSFDANQNLLWSG